jgi:hypothetical protein
MPLFGGTAPAGKLPSALPAEDFGGVGPSGVPGGTPAPVPQLPRGLPQLGPAPVPTAGTLAPLSTAPSQGDGTAARSTPPVAPPQGPAQDNGTRIEAAIKPVEDPVQILARQLAALGYEAVSGISIQGTPFDMAAHRKDGKRILVKRVPAVTAAEVKVFDAVTRKVAADACLLIVDRTEPGVRIAALGTSVQVTTPSEAARFLA